MKAATNINIKPFLALTLVLTVACTSVAPDPNTSRADEQMKARYFDNCEPATEVLPKLVSGRAPIYPVQRLLAEQDGHAVIEFEVTREGRANNLTKVESSHPSFYNHTRIAVAKWKFEPARQNGAPVRVRCRFRQEYFVPYKRRL